MTFPLEFEKTPESTAKEIAEEKLRAVGLDESYLKRLPAMLTGGEQHHFTIARALESRARIILVDEPTGNLDTENSEIVIDLLQKLAHEGAIVSLW